MEYIMIKYNLTKSRIEEDVWEIALVCVKEKRGKVRCTNHDEGLLVEIGLLFKTLQEARNAYKELFQKDRTKLNIWYINTNQI